MHSLILTCKVCGKVFTYPYGADYCDDCDLELEESLVKPIDLRGKA